MEEEKEEQEKEKEKEKQKEKEVICHIFSTGMVFGFGI